MGRWALTGVIAMMLAVPDAIAQTGKAVPYWVSLSASRARIRTGPSLDYPATWEYRRAGMPLKVIQVRDDWRRVEDPAGARGWMKFNMLSEERAGMVRDAVQTLHAAPDPAARIVWRVAPGVVGALSKCAGGWCLFDVRGRVGYIRSDALWGLSPGEQVE